MFIVFNIIIFCVLFICFGILHEFVVKFLQMLFRMGITVTSPKLPEDKRLCLFCHQFGDGVSDGPSRYSDQFQYYTLSINFISIKLCF